MFSYHGIKVRRTPTPAEVVVPTLNWLHPADRPRRKGRARIQVIRLKLVSKLRG